jgi:hypothetical protein
VDSLWVAGEFGGEGHGSEARARQRRLGADFSSTLRPPGETKRDRLSRNVEMWEDPGDDARPFIHFVSNGAVF